MNERRGDAAMARRGEGISQRLRRVAASPCRRVLVCLVVGLATACASTPPSADDTPPPPPSLESQTVMVLPAQPGDAPAPAALDAEIAFWLEERGPRVRWIFPPALERAVAGQPGMLDLRLRDLAVQSFRRAEVRRIGDPLFGDLRKLGALVDARYALVPVSASWAAHEAGRRVEVAAALIDTLGGNVLWYGVVAGDATDDETPAAASAARALARTLLR